MAAWIPAWLPEWAQASIAWALQPRVLTLLVVGSVALFVLNLIALPLLLTRVPADFFCRADDGALRPGQRRPRWLIALRVLKNAAGLVLLVAGVAMLFMPGQGVLTIAIALALLDFPGKRRAQRWLISRPAVHKPLNALRRRAGRPPLQLPDAGSS